jgi:cobalt-zinc-cadmium efflux system protein
VAANADRRWLSLALGLIVAFMALSAHVLAAEGGNCHVVRASIEELLRLEYHITHSTLQVDHADTDPAASSGYEVDPDDPDGHCADSHGASYRAPTGGET